MQSVSRILLADDQVAKNPAIDSKVVKEAERARRELETLGVWEDSGSRVRNPLEIRPALRQREQKTPQRMIQGKVRPSSGPIRGPM